MTGQGQNAVGAHRLVAGNTSRARRLPRGPPPCRFRGRSPPTRWADAMRLRVTHRRGRDSSPATHSSHNPRCLRLHRRQPTQRQGPDGAVWALGNRARMLITAIGSMAVFAGLLTLYWVHTTKQPPISPPDRGVDPELYLGTMKRIAPRLTRAAWWLVSGGFAILVVSMVLWVAHS